MTKKKPAAKKGPRTKGGGRVARFLKRLFFFGLGAALLLIGVTFWLYRTADDSLELGLDSRIVSEVTQLQKIQVGAVVAPRNIEEISTLLKNSKGPVSIGGARCSMGGQVAEPGSLHLDLRRFNRVLSFSPEERHITVEAGITWRDIQERIDEKDLSVMIMQTYSNFTVGGSLSVNAHGRYMGRGPIVQSVRSLRLVLANGDIVSASREENPELFFAAIGGYGGIGVIAEVTLELVANEKVTRKTETMATSAYAEYFRTAIRDNKKVVFHNADLHPPDFASARAVSWIETDAELTETARLIPRHDEYSWTPTLINGTVDLPGGFALRRYLLEPLFYSKEVVTWRNHEASYDIRELEPESREETTYVLREYFVPAARFDEFVPKMRDVFLKHDARIINVSVRHASADPGTLLAWARGETFAFVVYYAQGTSREEIAAVGRWSREMVDAVLSVGGTYYLPYQNHPTREQFQRAYPKAEEFFALKRRVDPELRFQNSLFYRYGPSPRAERDAALAALKYEKKAEGGTLLTIPEWYLVFNPIEYVEHLETGHPPDEFPFVESVREYLSLYKKVLKASEGVYPRDDEYVTMLRVIGASTAVEYLVKSAYEQTLGRFFRMTASDTKSQEEALIAGAARAYSQLIFDEPWYEFRFAPWIGRLWRETPLFGKNFLRRTERKLAFTAEFSVKAAYAQLLGLAAKSAYGPANDRVHVVVRVPEGTAARLPAEVVSLGEVSPGLQLLSLERWKEFSLTVPSLASAGYSFVEIAGNDDIAVSLVEEKNRPFKTELAQRLFRSRLVSKPDEQRSVWFVPVPRLHEFLADAREQGARLEHLYDY